MFIAETLDSVAKQSYPVDEVIISDDASSDSTVDVINAWKKSNPDLGVKINLLKNSKNLGVSGNANRALKASKGKWIKFLGADDVLLANCIEDNISYVNKNKDIRVLFSRVCLYLNNFDSENFIKIIPGGHIDEKSILYSEYDASYQHKMLLLSDRIHFSPSVFLHRETLLMVGGFDERFPLMEDYPLWLNLTGNGFKLYFMDIKTVNYRKHSYAINNSDRDYLIKPNYFRTERFRKICTYPYLPWDIRWNQKFNWFASQIFRIKRLKLNKNKKLLDFLTVWANPFRYIIYIRKKTIKRVKNDPFYL